MARKSTEIRQEEIKISVLKIIKNEGIKSISIKNLAKYTQLSEGAIYRHFKTKRAIILSIMDDVANDMIGALKTVALRSDSPQKRLHEYLCKTVTYLIKNNGITMLLFSEASQTNDLEMLEKLNYIFYSQRNYVKHIIREGMEIGLWNNAVDLDDFTTLYMGIPITLNINLLLSTKAFDTTHFCKRMMRLLEAALH